MRLRWWRGSTEEKQKVAEAEEQLHAVQQQWPQVIDAAAAMDRHRAKNGFAHAIRVAMGVER